MAGAPSPAFSPYKGPEIWDGGDSDGFRPGGGTSSVIGGDIVDEATAEGDGSFALGTGADSFGLNSAAFGQYAQTGIDGEEAFAAGPYTNAGGQNSSAVGGHANATAAHAQAFGSFSSATGVRAGAFGSHASAPYDDSWAMGYLATTTEVKQGVLRADKVRVFPRSAMPHGSTLELYDADGDVHVLGVTDTEVTFDGTPIGGGGGGGVTITFEEMVVPVVSGGFGGNLNVDGTVLVTLTGPVGVNENSVLVVVNGVVQERDTDWTYDAVGGSGGGPSVTVQDLVSGDRIIVKYATET